MRGIGAIVLAAGSSRRFGAPKQFLEFGGASFVRRAVDAALRGGCDPVVVVAGELCGEVVDELRGLRAEVIRNGDWERGIGTSIRCGLHHLSRAENELEGVIFLACDQPFVDACVIGDVIAAAKLTCKPIVACRYANTLGIPAYFHHIFFERLQALGDAAGAKSLIMSAAPDDVAEVEFERGAIDIDTPADFQSLPEQGG